jgi:hypothetical protein
MFPLEYHLLETFVVGFVGKFLRVDPINATQKNPRFCVAFNLDVGWVTKLGIIKPNAMTKMFIDYEQYPIQCKLYL